MAEAKKKSAVATSLWNHATALLLFIPNRPLARLVFFIPPSANQYNKEA